MADDDATSYDGDFRWEDGETETVRIRPGETKALRCGCSISWEQELFKVDGFSVPGMRYTACDKHSPDKPIYLTSLVSGQ